MNDQATQAQFACQEIMNWAERAVSNLVAAERQDEIEVLDEIWGLANQVRRTLVKDSMGEVDVRI